MKCTFHWSCPDAPMRGDQCLGIPVEVWSLRSGEEGEQPVLACAAHQRATRQDTTMWPRWSQRFVVSGLEDIELVLWRAKHIGVEA